MLASFEQALSSKSCSKKLAEINCQQLLLTLNKFYSDDAILTIKYKENNILSFLDKS